MKIKTKLRLAQIGGLLTTFAPLAVGVGIHYEDYFTTREAGTSLTLGGILAVAIVVLSMAGKGKKLLGNGFFVTGVIFALCILLEPIVLNLKYLTGLTFLGEAGNTAFFAPKVKELKKKIERAENVSAIKEAVRGSGERTI